MPPKTTGTASKNTHCTRTLFVCLLTRASGGTRYRIVHFAVSNLAGTGSNCCISRHSAACRLVRCVINLLDVFLGQQPAAIIRLSFNISQDKRHFVLVCMFFIHPYGKHHTCSPLRATGLQAHKFVRAVASQHHMPCCLARITSLVAASDVCSGIAAGFATAVCSIRITSIFRKPGLHQRHQHRGPCLGLGQRHALLRDRLEKGYHSRLHSRRSLV